MPIPYSARPGAHCARDHAARSPSVGAVLLAIDATSVATSVATINPHLRFAGATINVGYWLGS